MQFRDGYWTVMGDAATTVINPAHQTIIETLRTAGYPMTPKQLSSVVDTPYETLKVHLGRLVQRGLLVKDNGHYSVRIATPESVPAPPSAPRVTPVTVLPPEEPEATTGAADPVSVTEPPLQPMPLMYTPSCTPEVQEEAPTSNHAPALESNRVTPGTETLIPTSAPKDELIFRHTPTHGQPNGVSPAVGSTGPAACRHEVTTTETFWDGSVLVKCSRCKQMLDVQ